MTIEQTVEIPLNRRLFIDVPLEVPAEKAPANNSKLPTPITDSLVGILASAGDINPEQIREERLVKYLK